MSEERTRRELQAAIADHQAGHLAKAEVAYRSILRTYPAHADALHFLGLLHLHRGQMDQAAQLIGQSLVHAPQNPHAWNNLGNLFQMQGQTEEAKEAYGHVTRIAPDLAEAWYNLGVCLRDAGQIKEAARHLYESINRAPRFFRAYETLAMLCYRLGLNEETAKVYAAWSRLDPENAKARHMAAATSGTNVPRRASDAFVQTLFDRFASGFDDNLRQLGYRAPEIVAAALREHSSAAALPALDVLDAGCGTGLCGPLVRDVSRTLVGVDLSPKMIDRAHERGGYDELVAAEMTAFIQSRPAAFDAIISADTLVYFGALEEIAAAARSALRDGGIFIATVEALVDGAEPFRLEAHGRYAHRDSYMRDTLAAAGFGAIRLSDETLRRERMQDVRGYIVLARRSG